MGKISLAVGVVAVLSLAVAGCGPEAPAVPHHTEGLEDTGECPAGDSRMGALA